MNLQDRLFGETDDSCARCGFSNPQSLTIHHIDGNRRNNSYENQIVLCYTCHQRHHEKRGVSRKEIELRKRHLIQKTVTTYGMNAMKIAARNGIGVVAHPFLLFHLVDLGYMTQKELQQTYEADDGGEVDVEALFAITAKGRKVLSKWL